MKHIKNLTITILIAVFCFFAAMYNLLGYVGSGRSVNLIFAIANAILCVVNMYFAFRTAKALDEHIAAIYHSQDFALDVLQKELCDMQLITECCEKIAEKVCRLQNNSITLRSEDKGRPSPAE